MGDPDLTPLSQNTLVEKLCAWSPSLYPNRGGIEPGILPRVYCVIPKQISMPLWALVLLFCLVFLLESIFAVPSEHVYFLHTMLGTNWAHFAVTTSVGPDEPVLT